MKTEEPLARNEKIYRSLLKISPDAIIVIDKDGDMIKVNDQASKLIKMSRSEMIGKAFVSIFKSPQTTEMEQFYNDLIQNENPASKEFTFIRKDGSQFIGELNASFLIDKDRNVEMYIAIIRDITKRISAENEIQKSSERYINLIESMNEGLIILDKNDLFTYMNTCAIKIFETSLDELMGQPIKRFLNDDARKLFRKNIQMMKKKSSSFKFEIKIIKNDGSFIFLFMSLSGIYGIKNDYLGCTAIVSDITAEKKAREERDHFENELLHLFFNRLSHREMELLNYLTHDFIWPEDKREIGKIMDVLPGTLDKFMARIKTKLHINDIDKIIDFSKRMNDSEILNKNKKM